MAKLQAAHNLTLGCALLFYAVSVAPLPAQNAPEPSSEATLGPAFGAEDAPPPELAFEVASIRPNKSGGSHSSTGFNNGRFTVTNTNLKTLMQYNAFGIPEAQILAQPAWLSTDRFDIDAKLDDTVAEQMKNLGIEAKTRWMHQIVQQLLADRFKLVFHWETKEMPVYALNIAKSGAKVNRSKNADGGPSVSWNNGSLTAKNVTIGKLAQTLTIASSRELGRIVIDQTGLEGKYDLTLTWAPDDRSASLTDKSNDYAAPPGPSIFTALQEQLGLKLESTKAPVQTLVIDHIEQPSEN